MAGPMNSLEKKLAERGRPSLAAASSLALFRSPWLPVSGSVLTGVLLALCFPGYGNSTLVFVALVPLMFAVQSASTKKAAWLGLLAGFVFFAGSLAWLLNLTDKVEGIGLKASVWLGYAVLALYCAAYVVPFAIVSAVGTRQWAGEKLWKNLRLMFSLTMVWTGAEYLRGFLFTGFPWNPLGVSQYANPAVIQVAEWGGVHIVSAYIVWMNAAIFITFRQYTHGTRARKYRPHLELMIGLLPVALAVMHGMNVLLNRPPFFEKTVVALIQPNIPQTEKWDDAKDQQIRETLAELSGAAARLDGIDLVIWPETALPDFLRASRPSYELVKSVAGAGVPLLVGSMDVALSENGRTYFNSSILIGTNGIEIAKYDKQHLVPFGEYVPFPGLMRKFTPIDVDFGRGDGSTLLQLPGGASFSALICFEDIVAPLSVQAVRTGARWLVNQTNDAWFDPSAQSEQHLAHAVFRCIENRVPMARCGNTGVTCLIDAYGGIERNLAIRTKGFTTGEFHPRPVGLGKTFYTRNGDTFAKFCLIAGATVFFVFRTKEWKRRKGHESEQG